ncbi:MAG TPA: outer-membrane lipoprotein carrier protein LolA [Acidobacteriota bacterium]|nr:outer-membrane lipoprotein carrier protein LolA [Acidobacteriota bacterium]
MLTIRGLISFLAVAVTSSVFGYGQITLDEILENMDRVGADLKSMRAGLQQKKWTDILEEYDEGESGRFLFLKDKQGIYLRKDIDDPTTNFLVIKEGTVLFYQPSIKQAQEYKMGRHKDKAEFLLLGFGSDQATLAETYDISFKGEEEIGGQKTYQLELKPKSEQVAAFFSRIELWIDGEKWVPIQQKLVEPTQDHLLIRFEDLELNPKLSKGDFNVKLPKDVRVIRN